MIAATWGAATDRGPRPGNEDSYTAVPPVFVVADGLGGHAAGQVASAIAVKELGLLAGRDDVAAADVLASIDRANASILEEASRDFSRAGMGTTITGLVSVVAGGDAKWLVINVGDSRVYRFGNGELVQLTTDHSEVEELVAAGVLSRDQARTHALRNVVTRCLGTYPPPSADSLVVPPAGGERFIICSDGLSSAMTDSEISAVVGAVADPQELADRLVAGSLAAGGSDNVTVIVLDTSVVDATPAPPP